MGAGPVDEATGLSEERRAMIFKGGGVSLLIWV